MTVARIVVAGLFAALPIFVTAQEGFPLDGTWRGAYGPAGADAAPVVLVMKWNGAGINGLINPGRNSVAFTVASSIRAPGPCASKLTCQMRPALLRVS